MTNELSTTTQQVGKSEQFGYLPAKNIDDMKPSLSLAALSRIDSKLTKVEVVKIIHKYLSATPKAKSLDDLSFELITEDILETDKNLSLQEIEFIFKKGVTGAFGTIYGEISMDTILGEGGWIDIYYRDYRGRKPLKAKADYELTGNEITHKEFLSKNPEYASKSLDFQIKPKVQEWTIDLLKEKLGDSFSELFESASKEFDNMIDKLNQLENIIKKNPNKVEAAMYDAFLVQKKAGKEEFIINRLRRKVK